MLHTATVESRTLGLLKRLMAEPDLAPFNLVGGTALSLRIGHRQSYDLDLFGYPDALNIPMISSLLLDYGTFEVQTASKNIFSAWVDGIKVDFVRYQYQLLEPVSIEDGIRLVSLEDIAAMKLAAVTGRGRKRDFSDIYFLLNHFALPEMIDLYLKKYPDSNRFLLIKSLDYFEDAAEDSDPVFLQKADWPSIKKTISQEVHKLFK